jgi:hypothetical protein
MFFGPSLENLLCFWGFLIWSPARFDEKKWRDFCPTRSNIGKHHCPLLSTDVTSLLLQLLVLQLLMLLLRRCGT